VHCCAIVAIQGLAILRTIPTFSKRQLTIWILLILNFRTLLTARASAFETIIKYDLNKPIIITKHNGRLRECKNPVSHYNMGVNYKGEIR